MNSILKNKKSSFSLVEVLIALAVVGIGAFAFLELMLSVSRRAFKIEMDTYVNNAGIQLMGKLRGVRLRDFESYPNDTTFAGCVSFKSAEGISFPNVTATSCTITNLSELRSFCSSNRDYCETKKGYKLSEIYEAVMMKNVAGCSGNNCSKIINIYVGCKQGCDSYIKLTTIVSNY